jgi:hypothetical protein
MKYLISVVITLFCFIGSYFSQDASLIYKSTVNSTVTIITDNGSQGSGFFIAPNIIATNYHVIEGSSVADCYLNNSDIQYKIDGYLAVDKAVDLILLKVSGLDKPAIKFSTSLVSIGQKVFVIGSPKGLSASITDGIISGMRDFDGYKLIQMSAPISPGSSGGPVLNQKGELIGISVLQYKEGQNLNFAIPMENLKILMDFKRDFPMSLSKLSENQYTENKGLRIGQHYAGGIIFYIDKTGQHGLVCSETDLFNSSGYSAFTYQEALLRCNQLVLNGFDDWYLPTYDELIQIRINKNSIPGLETKEYSSYWSTTSWINNKGEESKINNYVMYFGETKYANHDGFTNHLRVRAVRGF